MDFIDAIPLSRECNVIAAHECGLIAINKKAGRASHPNGGNSEVSAIVRAPYNFDGEYYSWLDADGLKRRLYLVNRLDSPTSGVILAASTPEAAEEAKKQFRNKFVEKIYAAVVVGKLMPNCGLWSDRISTTNVGGRLRSVGGATRSGQSHLAMTEYKVEQFDENGLNTSLVFLKPKTGLTHQLRVQCARRAHPILGDATYGNFSVNKKIRHASGINRLFLHCMKTALKMELDGVQIDFCAQAPLPESFNSIIKFNRDVNFKKF